MLLLRLPGRAHSSLAHLAARGRCCSSSVLAARATASQPATPHSSPPVQPADFLLVDAHPLLYAAHFSMPTARLRTGAGLDTTVAFVFLRTLLLLLERVAPSHAAVVMDVTEADALVGYAAARTPPGWDAPWRPNSTALLPNALSSSLRRIDGVAAPRTWRHDVYPDYKAGRNEAPPEIAAALPVLLELLDALGVPTVGVATVEADDVIATLARRAVDAGLSVAVASSDKDFMQLIGPRLGLVHTHKGALEWFGEAEFAARFPGLPGPASYAHLQSLMGDTVDNIPGVRNIGEKTALQLLRDHGGALEAVLAVAATAAAAPGDGAAAAARRALGSRAAVALAAPGAAAAARLSLCLATLRDDVDVPLLARPPDAWGLAGPPQADGGAQALRLAEGLSFGAAMRARVAAFARGGPAGLAAPRAYGDDGAVPP